MNQSDKVGMAGVNIADHTHEAAIHFYWPGGDTVDEATGRAGCDPFAGQFQTALAGIQFKGWRGNNMTAQDAISILRVRAEKRSMAVQYSASRRSTIWRVGMTESMV